jgi:hypothetical protein
MLRHFLSSQIPSPRLSSDDTGGTGRGAIHILFSSPFAPFAPDIDECFLGMDNCDRAEGICHNTLGSFFCSCRSGTTLIGTSCSPGVIASGRGLFWRSLDDYGTLGTVSVGGDINGDGIRDMAFSQSNAESGVGRVFIAFMASTGTSMKSSSVIDHTLSVFSTSSDLQYMGNGINWGQGLSLGGDING